MREISWGGRYPGRGIPHRYSVEEDTLCGARCPGKKILCGERYSVEEDTLSEISWGGRYPGLGKEILWGRRYSTRDVDTRPWGENDGDTLAWGPRYPGQGDTLEREIP